MLIPGATELIIVSDSSVSDYSAEKADNVNVQDIERELLRSGLVSDAARVFRVDSFEDTAEAVELNFSDDDIFDEARALRYTAFFYSFL